MTRPLLCMIAVVALAACGDEPSTEGQSRDGGRAESEVQGGTISDAMIPFDTLTSQSPPLKRKPAAEAGDESGGEDEVATESAAEPAVTATDEDEASAHHTPAPAPETADE